MDTAVTRLPDVRKARRARTLPRWRDVLPIALGGLLCTFLGVTAAVPGLTQLALAGTVVVLLFAGCLREPERAVVGLMVWLVIIGTVRRVIEAASPGTSANVLLLVAPVAVAALVAVAVQRGAFRARTPLANVVMWLSILVVLSAGNPMQGGVAVGAAGLLFVLVPMLWFWIGRAFVDERSLERLLTVISVLAVPAAVYGLVQVYRGFPSWDAYWIQSKGYVALRVGDSLRQFASFASTAEYVAFLAVAAVVWALKLRRLARAVPAGIAVVILGWALALASARAILVVLPIALGLVFAASRGYGLAKSLVLGLAGLAILGAVVSSFDPGQVGGRRTSALLSRQVQGLSDPFNPRVSTLPGHITDITAGIRRGVLNPIGKGVGSVTLAAEKFGGKTAGTEADPSNVAVATGLPGLLAYGFIVVAGFRLAFRTARRRRDVASLAALGILVVTLFQWLNGGTYAVAPLPWLFLGWLDQQSIPRPLERTDALVAQEDFASASEL